MTTTIEFITALFSEVDERSRTYDLRIMFRDPS